QAADGIRDATVTGVQTCALPICLRLCPAPESKWRWPQNPDSCAACAAHTARPQLHLLATSIPKRRASPLSSNPYFQTPAAPRVPLLSELHPSRWLSARPCPNGPALPRRVLLRLLSGAHTTPSFRHVRRR